MAEVTRTTIPVTAVKAGYTLTLDEEEALALVFVLRRVGGPLSSPRGKLDSILKILQPMVVEDSEFDDGMELDDSLHSTGSIRFE